MKPSGIPVFVDARCLQDPNYQSRGVGFHTSALLKYAYTHLEKQVSITGLLDEAAGNIPKDCRSYLPSLRHHFNPSLASPAVFINASPMTHDPVLNARFLRHDKVLSAAVVYDFIPFDRRGYFATDAEKNDYFGTLHWLKLHDRFFPISRYSATRLQEICGIESNRITVTGAPVRSVFYESSTAESSSTRHGIGSSVPYFIFVGGQEPRKNTETVIRAINRLNAQSSVACGLKIVGRYTPDYQDTLRKLYKIGDPTVIEFLSGIEDIELAFLYRHAVAAVAASYVEGFSLPVVEAIACGCPVIASRCEAHAELISQNDALFEPDDAESLADKLALIRNDPVHRKELAACQSVIVYQFHEQVIGERFWRSVLQVYERRFQKSHRGVAPDRKPRVALLTPYPPDESGVARYSKQTVLAADKFLDIDVYTNGLKPIGKGSGEGRVVGNISIEPFLRNHYDAVVSVLGNSKFHASVFDLFEKFGGPCIVHDSRYTHFHLERLGQERFLQFAASILKREVHAHELHGWLLDKDLPSLFLEPIVKKADPLIVHTEKAKKLIFEKYGVDAVCLPFAATMKFDDAEISLDARRAAKRRLNIAENVLVLSSFGYTHFNKGSLECIMALDQLLAWKIPTVLYLVGINLVDDHIRELLRRLNVSEKVHVFSDFLADDVYRDYMLATDVAVQLRTYGYGQPSGGLTECISAGLPTVANEDLAESCDAPRYIKRVPDHLSPLLIAEAVADIFETRAYQERVCEERLSFCARHNFDYYAQELSRILS